MRCRFLGQIWFVSIHWFNCQMLLRLVTPKHLINAKVWRITMFLAPLWLIDVMIHRFCAFYRLIDIYTISKRQVSNWASLKSIFRRFVKAGGNEKVYTFTVPYDGCGSKASCSVCASVDNILVIQSDEEITETWDTARRITCSRGETTEKTIYFKPFVGEPSF